MYYQLYHCLAEDEEGERKKSMGEDSDSRGGFLACDLFKQSVYFWSLACFMGNLLRYQTWNDRQISDGKFEYTLHFISMLNPDFLCSRCKSKLEFINCGCLILFFFTPTFSCLCFSLAVADRVYPPFWPLRCCTTPLWCACGGRIRSCVG